MKTGFIGSGKMAEAVLAACPGERVYCLNEIVHNRQVVSRLTAAGMVFVSDPAAVPQGARLLFSAHGVSPEVRRQAAARRRWWPICSSNFTPARGA